MIPFREKVLRKKKAVGIKGGLILLYIFKIFYLNTYNVDDQKTNTVHIKRRRRKMTRKEGEGRETE